MIRFEFAVPTDNLPAEMCEAQFTDFVTCHVRAHALTHGLVEPFEPLPQNVCFEALFRGDSIAVEVEFPEETEQQFDRLTDGARLDSRSVCRRVHRRQRR